MLVVELDSGRNAAAIVGHRDRAVGVNCDDNVVTVSGQRLVNRVVYHFEHHVMQTGAIGGVANVHARALSYGLQAFKLLNAAFVVGRAGVAFDHGVLFVLVSDAHRHYDIFERVVAG